MNLYGFCGNDGVNRWDVLGEYYTVEEKGNEIIVTVPIVFDGLVPRENADNIMNVARLSWGGGLVDDGRGNAVPAIIDGKTVKIEFVELSQRPENSEAYNLIKIQRLGENERSKTDYYGADKAAFVTIKDDQADSGWLIAHEIGHVLGNKDHYTVIQELPGGPRRVSASEINLGYPIRPNSEAPEEGWGGNVMGDRTGRIDIRNIRETLSRPATLRTLRGPMFEPAWLNWWDFKITQMKHGVKGQFPSDTDRVSPEGPWDER